MAETRTAHETAVVCHSLRTTVTPPREYVANWRKTKRRDVCTRLPFMTHARNAELRVIYVVCN
jgi:hypothetical protein